LETVAPNAVICYQTIETNALFATGMRILINSAMPLRSNCLVYPDSGLFFSTNDYSPRKTALS
jgi:hypothetical protein